MKLLPLLLSHSTYSHTEKERRKRKKKEKGKREREWDSFGVEFQKTLPSFPFSSSPLFLLILFPPSPLYISLCIEDITQCEYCTVLRGNKSHMNFRHRISSDRAWGSEPGTGAALRSLGQAALEDFFSFSPFIHCFYCLFVYGTKTI